MNFIELARFRYSCRNYLPRPVEQDKLEYLLEAGRIAPSAANYQPWEFIVIRDPALLEKIHETYKREWFMKAPVVIVICGDHSASWKRADGKDHCDVDVAIAADHITLAAAEQGLATCWICNFDAKQASAVLQLPENLEPAVILSLGYPADKPDTQRHATKRKPFDEVVHWNTF